MVPGDAAHNSYSRLIQMKFRASVNRRCQIFISFNDHNFCVFGKHNLTNINAARLACNAIGITNEHFYAAIQSFKGASNRLELLFKNETCAVYKDFAHSPSKLKATVEALKAQFPKRKLVACMELHTFSSLTEKFLEQYIGAMDCADVGIIFFNPETVAHKKLPPITSEMIFNAFQRSDLEIFHSKEQLENRILTMNCLDTVFAFMSSGNFGGMDLKTIAKEIPSKSN